MKKSLTFKNSLKLAIATASLICFQAFSDNAFAAEPAFDQGSNTIALGVGFGLNYNYYGSYTSSPALAFTYDHGFFPEVGPGTIGIGGIFAYKSASYDYGYSGYKAKWTNTIVAVRGTYHFTGLAEKNNKFDPYAGAIIGLRFYSHTDGRYDFDNYGYDRSYTYIVTGVFAGAKYNFVPAFGAFAELGYDVSFAKIGINFNF